MQPYPCLLCGQTVTPSVTPPSPTPDASTIEEVTDQIRLIDATRLKLLRHLNILQSSTSKLPPEILSEIFTYVSDLSPPETHTQVTLGAVSTYWRQVVCSAPQLWATARINVEPKTVALKAELLKLYFRTAQDVPLSFGLILRKIDHSSSSDFYPILQALLEGAHKFVFLELSRPPETWLPILSPHLQKLEDLSLFRTWNHGDDHLTDSFPQVSHFLNIPSLRRVYLNSCRIGGRPPNQLCHSITKLHLICVGESISTQLLMLCPNLVSFRCESSFLDSPGYDMTSYPAITTFQKMRFFQVPHFATTRLFDQFLSRLRFPVLKTINIGFSIHVLPAEHWLSFIQSLPATCSTLEIAASFSFVMIPELIQATPPQVRSLELLSIESSDLAMLLLTLCDNIDTTVFGGMRGLRHIVIAEWSGDNVVEDREETIPQLFLDMVSARKELLGGKFLLEIDSESYDDTPWTHLQGRLRALISDGFRLEVFVAGELIPCLQEIYDELGCT